MSKKEQPRVKSNRNSQDSPTEGEDIFASEGPGEFGELAPAIEPALGALCRISLLRGGYFGVSVTDDGGSLRLAIRNGKFYADKRFYRTSEFEAAVAKAFSRLREVTSTKNS